MKGLDDMPESASAGIALALALGLPAVAQSSAVAKTTPQSIQEAGFVEVGGVEPWVTIRGADRANPVLLLLHGGPGDAQSALKGVYAVYEKDFTLVQWDQPGAGRTFVKNPTRAPEPERVVSDGIELAEYLTRHLGKRNVVLLGHSWGSHLGVDMARRRPDLFAA